MGGSRVRPKPQPQPVRPTAAILPRGPVETPNPNASSFGAQWENLHPHYDLIAREATPRGLPIPLVVAVGLIESGWKQTWPSGPNRGKVIEVHDDYGGGPSVGFMQVKPFYWQSLIPTADAYTLAGNIALGCELLTRKIAERGSWQEAIKRDYHPGVSPNGTTPESYVRCITALIQEWDRKAEGDEPKPPTPPPKPEPTAALVFGRAPHPPYQDRIVGNSGAWNDLGPRTIVGTCLHSMVGTLAGTDSYFRNEARLTALTDYGVGGATDGALDGVIYRWNDPKGRRAPYANGGNGPEGDGPAFIRRYGVSAINRDLVSIERSDGGNVNTTVSPKQFEAIARIMAYWHDQAKVPWSAFPINPAGGVVTQLQHFEFSEKACPFPPVRAITTRYQDRVRAILREYQTGAGPQPPTPNPDPVAPSDGYPRGMDAELAKTLFGAFVRKMPDGGTQRYGFDPSPKGVASAAWLARGDEEDEFPEARQWLDQPGGGVVLTWGNGWALRYDPGTEKRPWFWVGDETP